MFTSAVFHAMNTNKRVHKFEPTRSTRKAIFSLQLSLPARLRAYIYYIIYTV